MLIVMKTRQYQNNKSINHHQLIKLKAKIIRVHTIIALMINNRQLNKKNRWSRRKGKNKSKRKNRSRKKNKKMKSKSNRE
jgi:hypothetical protein